MANIVKAFTIGQVKNSPANSDYCQEHLKIDLVHFLETGERVIFDLTRITGKPDKNRTLKYYISASDDEAVWFKNNVTEMERKQVKAQIIGALAVDCGSQDYCQKHLKIDLLHFL